jgi:ABC-type transport system involved in cytochrome c biogenesis permease subunit
MATANPQEFSGAATRAADDAGFSLSAVVWQACQLLGSLKLTVVLFVLATILVFVGTLAQEDLNMVEVKERYFTSWIASMRIEDFFPQAFWRHENIPGEIPFPGGALIGALLLANLLAAKFTRFHMHAKGTRLWAGLAFFGFGLLLCYWVVVAGHVGDGVQGEPPVSYETLWRGLVTGLAVLWMTTAYLAWNAARKGWRWIWGGVALAFGALGVAALLGYFEMSPSSLRITWQLMQGTVVGAVMLVGSVLLFDKQGGNLLLHFGVALLMVGQFAFGDQQLEQRLTIAENEVTNTLVNMDALELAFIDRSNPDEEKVVAVPEAKLVRLAGTDGVLQDDRLPVNIKILQFFPNSDLAEIGSEPNPASVGNGLQVRAVSRPKAGGVNSEVDYASAYVELLDKSSGESLGTFMLAQLLNDRSFLTVGRNADMLDEVKVGEATYALGLRFARVPKPYWVKLKDVRQVRYSGTSTPRDYSSFITLIDTETGNKREERVWMNNPLRYRGETFYQSDYGALPGGKEYTSIQVVRNSGWMIPYVACMIVAVGMCFHFTGTLDRFMGRRERERAREAAAVSNEGKVEGKGSRIVAVSLIALSVFTAVGALIPWTAVRTAMRPDSRNEKYDLYEAGKIPTRYGGRVMPLDSFAQQVLRAVSNRSSLSLTAASNQLPPAPRDIVDRAKGSRRLSALQWLLEIAAGEPSIRELHMFRIDADELLSEFKLERRKSNLYSLAELAPGLASFDRLVQSARGKESRKEVLEFKESKALELASRLSAFQMVDLAFGEPALPPVPAEFQGPNVSEDQRRQAQVMALAQQMSELRESSVAAIIPPQSQTTSAVQDVAPWVPFTAARFFDLVGAVNGGSGTPGVETFGALVKAYRTQDPEVFNKAVDDHLTAVSKVAPVDYRSGKVAVERWLDALQPTFTARILYGLLAVVGLVSMALGSRRLNWGVWGSLVAVAMLHTFDLLARIYITGRAPVINLYSSAVFIGWAAVLAGLVLETIYRRGIGNLIAATLGLLSLMVAWTLNTGDTMPVLQAVLDTQFWLATHVITVTLGYSATFLAGALGIVYLVLAAFRREGLKDALRDVYRMAYSATCFGILFSFVGTVLGGLWADDSWGRFWGWDPKENGALLIVIWNALVLHARWDGMVRERGFAMLAVFGNIVTAWSWFGTNQLGIGLHAYGFTQGALLLLTLFVLSQLAILGLAWAVIKPVSVTTADATASQAEGSGAKKGRKERDV